MRLAEVELVRVAMPLVSPFRTSFGTTTRRDVLLVHVTTDEAEGWAECASDTDPRYSSEYVEGCADVLRRFFVPAVAAAGDVDATAVEQRLAPYKGHWMAKAALHTAVLDAELREAGRSLAEHLGATRDRVDSGVSVGIMDSVPQLLEAVEGYLAEGYVRIKLKIEPGWDVPVVRAVREHVGDAVPLQVDANAAYTSRDLALLARLDDFGLLLIEQPLPEDDLLGHADLARSVRTPICLDESVTSVRTAAAAIRLGACRVVNIKPGRVGGYAEAGRIAKLCEAHGVAVWCGGMLETGIGRAANLALAAMPQFTLPGDTSASGRYYKPDLTEPFVLDRGALTVPTGPGIGVVPLPDVLADVITGREPVPLR